jgi:hypothetical protein
MQTGSWDNRIRKGSRIPIFEHDSLRKVNKSFTLVEKPIKSSWKVNGLDTSTSQDENGISCLHDPPAGHPGVTNHSAWVTDGLLVRFNARDGVLAEKCSRFRAARAASADPCPRPWYFSHRMEEVYI